MEVDPQLQILLKPILEWLDDPRTEEVAINRPGEAFVRQAGAFLKFPLPVSYDDLEDIAILAGALRKQDVDHATHFAQLNFQTASGCKSVCRRRYRRAPSA